MTTTRQPDESKRVKVHGYDVVTYSYGTGDEVVLLLNGGPGLPCNYLRDPHLSLVDEGYRVVTYDQLGCGASDKPEDSSLWTMERYVQEVDVVREALGIQQCHLIGHSWGGWLGIEYALTYPRPLKSFVIANSCADMPHLISELNRLREALGSETVKMMLRHEAEGTLDHPEYQAAITILNYRHVCRLDEWPDSVRASLDDWNMGPYGTMQGPNEFCYTGNLKDWNRAADLKKMNIPCLIVVGMHDELTPACALRMHNALPNSEIAVFKNSSHMPMYEESEAYYATIKTFLSKQQNR